MSLSNSGSDLEEGLNAVFFYEWQDAVDILPIPVAWTWDTAQKYPWAVAE